MSRFTSIDVDLYDVCFFSLILIKAECFIMFDEAAVKSLVLLRV